MPPTKPEDWPKEFARLLNTADLEGVLALYEPGAVVSRRGKTVGLEGVRDMLAELIRKNTCLLKTRVIRAVTVDDIAVLYTDFAGSTVEGLEATATEIEMEAVEVLRRQPDGTWKLIVGDPSGRG